MKTFKKNHFFLIIVFCLNNFTLISFGQQIISGIVVDKISGEPISGVGVKEINSTFGTITNEDGEFNYTVHKIPANIVFTHVAFKKQQTIYENLDKKNIRLELNIIQLPEIKSGNPATAIINNVIQKAKSDTNSKHYYKAFYQKISTFKGKYSKIHEMFLNASWSQLGVDLWEPTNVRYAQMDDQKYCLIR
jgi:hypothetical protein